MACAGEIVVFSRPNSLPLLLQPQQTVRIAAISLARGIAAASRHAALTRGEIKTRPLAIEASLSLDAARARRAPRVGESVTVMA